ncbi:unnamed protein product [Acanthoscelides obtectus]|nr:unnamed protein product [Acanthoscelides obtectus]CAK1638017.1 Anillin [Acanthoscelides obtectus]
MGKKALLRRSSLEQSDYLVVQELILEKYSTKIKQYLERNRMRRKSRYEHFEEYLSSGRHTPSSISSLNSLDGAETDRSEENIQNVTGKSDSTSSVSSDLKEERYTLSSTKPESTDNGELAQNNSDSKDEDLVKYTKCKEWGITIPQYERQDNHDNIQTGVENAADIKYEASKSQISINLLNFMKSVDDSNVHSPANSTMTSTYSETKFIANALSGVNLSQEHEDNNSTINSVSYESLNDESITTSKISDLISKDSTLTNGISNGQRFVTTNSVYETEASQNNHLELGKLTAELSLQSQMFLQASKAVKHCRANDMLHSMGYIEAERVLLLTTASKKALNEEIHSLLSKKYSGKNEPNIRNGEIKIENMTIEFGSPRPSSRHDKILEVFVVLVKCGKEVHGSRVLQNKSNKFKFDKVIKLGKLRADFKIGVEIYSMAVTLQEDCQYNCPSPMNIFYATRHSKRSSFINEDANINVTSAFTLIRNCDIRITDLAKIDGNGILMLQLQNSDKKRASTDKVCLKLQSTLKFNSCLRGFLTIGTENEHKCIIWNRRWCMLKGSTLEYWNHPSEEEFARYGSIDLRDCSANCIGIAERQLCSRPRTLLLPIKKDDTAKRYFLATDNNTELEAWNKQLNVTVRALKLWRNSEICCNA